MKYQHATANFTIELQENWVENTESDFLQFLEPINDVSITISAYSDSSGTLEDFRDFRLTTVEEFYQEAKPAWTIDVPKAYVYEFIGTWPGEDSQTYYIVDCIHVGSALLSVGIVSSPEYRVVNDKQINEILGSIKSLV